MLDRYALSINFSSSAISVVNYTVCLAHTLSKPQSFSDTAADLQLKKGTSPVGLAAEITVMILLDAHILIDAHPQLSLENLTIFRRKSRKLIASNRRPVWTLQKIELTEIRQRAF